MQTLLTVLIAWLSVNFDLPAVAELPKVEFVTAAKMAEVRYSRLGTLRADRVPAEAGRTAPGEQGSDVFAIYDDVTRTIYLPKNWTGRSPGEVSVLVHELVHHLQNVGRLDYDCAGARERPAYKAQAGWLELFGRNLAGEFGLDPMTVLVRSSCMR